MGSDSRADAAKVAKHDHQEPKSTAHHLGWSTRTSAWQMCRAEGG